MLRRKPIKKKTPAEKRARTLRKRRLGKEAVARSAVKAARVWKSREHLDRVRAHGCLLNGPMCWGPMDAHHCRKLQLGTKLPRDDRFCVPLCRHHHNLAHEGFTRGERYFWECYQIDPRDFIRSFSPEGAAALAELERAASGKG